MCYREMLERALVKRLRDSDSDSDQESESSSRPKKPSTDRPTDILTTDRLTDPQVTHTDQIHTGLTIHVNQHAYLCPVCCFCRACQ